MTEQPDAHTMLTLIEDTLETILQHEILTIPEIFLVSEKLGLTMAALDWLEEGRPEMIPAVSDHLIAGGLSLLEFMSQHRTFTTETYVKIKHTISVLNQWLTRN